MRISKADRADALPQLQSQVERNGGGGVLYSEKKEEKDSSSSSSEKSTDAYNLASTLRDLGVFVIAPPKRAKVAAELCAADITTADIQSLAAFIAESEPDEVKQRRYLASIVVDAVATKQALADLEEFRRRCGPSVAAPRAPQGDRSVWERDSEQLAYVVMGFARDWGRRMAPDELLQAIADRIKKTPDETRALLQRGQELQTPPHKKLVIVKDETDVPAERMRRLREKVQQDKLTKGGGA